MNRFSAWLTVPFPHALLRVARLRGNAILAVEVQAVTQGHQYLLYAGIIQIIVFWFLKSMGWKKLEYNVILFRWLNFIIMECS